MHNAGLGAAHLSQGDVCDDNGVGRIALHPGPKRAKSTECDGFSIRYVMTLLQQAAQVGVEKREDRGVGLQACCAQLGYHLCHLCRPVGWGMGVGWVGECVGGWRGVGVWVGGGVCRGWVGVLVGGGVWGGGGVVVVVGGGARGGARARSVYEWEKGLEGT